MKAVIKVVGQDEEFVFHGKNAQSDAEVVIEQAGETFDSRVVQFEGPRTRINYVHENYVVATSIISD